MIVIGLIIFILAVIFCFLIPGRLLLSYSKINFGYGETITLSLITGFITFTLISYVFLLLNLNYLLFIPVVTANLLFIIRKRNLLAVPKIHLNKLTVMILLVLIIGVIGQLLIIAPSGLEIDNNIIFYSAHGHDGPWHIAVANELLKMFPFENPVLANEKLVNYHFFSDISLAEFNYWLRLPMLDLYFRFFPLLFSFLLGLTSFFIARRIGNSNSAGIWGMFFTLFCGSFGYLLTLPRSGNLNGETLFWTTQIQSSVGNPPQIISCFLMLAILIYIFELIKKQDKIIFLILCLFCGTLTVFKVYAGVVLLGGLFIISLYQILKDHKFYLFILFILSSILSAVLYLPNTYQSGSFLIFEPWWYIRVMIVADNKLNLLDWEHKRQTYLSEGNWKRVLQIEIQGFLIFLFGNLGMRFLAFYKIPQFLKESIKDYFNSLCVAIILISFVLPLLFLQKGVATNSIQFMQYFLLLMGILAGVAVSDILKRIKPFLGKAVIILIIIVLSVPTQIGLIYDFYKNPPLSKISQTEVDGLEFIKNNALKSEIILTAPFDKYFETKETVKPIWAWSDSAYVSAFSDRKTFLADTEQVDIMGYDYKNREKVQKEIFQGSDSRIISDLIKINHITWIYFPNSKKPEIDLEKIPGKLVYSNNEVSIWKIN